MEIENYLVAEPLSEVDASQDNVDAVVRQFRAEAAEDLRKDVPDSELAALFPGGEPPATGRSGRLGEGRRVRYSPEASPRLRVGLGAWEKDDAATRS